MNYSKATLSAPNKEAIEADIRILSWNGKPVYPDYPDGYEVSMGPYQRFVVTPPCQEVIAPGEYTEDGTEITTPVLGNWVCKLVLPFGYETSNLSTKIDD